MKLPKRENQSDGNGSGVFLKLADGESVTGVFRGEPYTFYSYWNPAERKSYVVDATNELGKERYRLNFVMRDNDSGQLVAKIWEFAGPVYDQLSAIHEEYPLPETTVKITRKGMGKETEYHLLPILKTPLTKAQLEQIAAVKLQILNHAPKVEQKEKEGPFP